MIAALKRLAPIEDEHVYTVSVTRLRVRHLRHLPRLVRSINGVMAQADRTPGLVANGVRLKILRLEFSTYGAFADRADLARYTTAADHGEVFRALRHRLGPLTSTKEQVRGAALPATWSEVDRLIESAEA